MSEEPKVDDAEVKDNQEVSAKEDEAVVLVTSDTEAKALKMGWSEKADFKGDPAKWRSAEEFVERGETMLPILKATVHRQERKIEELSASMKEFSEYHTKSEQRAYDRAIKELKARQLDAVSVADTAAFSQIDEEITALQKEATAIPDPKGKRPEDDPVYTEWLSRNDWAEKDQELIEYAEVRGYLLSKKDRSLRGKALLEAITKDVKSKFPDKFVNPRREAAGSVEGTSSVASRKGGKSFADMPKDERDACDRMAKNAYGDSPKEASEFKTLFVKTHFSEVA